jgi:hypothetical protein
VVLEADKTMYKLLVDMLQMDGQQAPSFFKTEAMNLAFFSI